MNRSLAALVYTFVAGSLLRAQGNATETIVHNFGVPLPGGAAPVGCVIRDGLGNLYGTTTAGGTAPVYAGYQFYQGYPGLGTIFKMNAAGEETVLHNFIGGSDGAEPVSGVVADPAGNLYGTTGSGGAANAGVIYELSPSGEETILYNFTGGADGAYAGNLVRDSAGNLYGTTEYNGRGYGVVFKLDAAGKETVLHAFTGPDGAYPSSLIVDAAGNLYGTTNEGGTTGYGVIFKLDSSGHETVLYRFNSGFDGINPNGLVFGTAGNLYGTTLLGGASGPHGYGEVFELDAAGKLTVLYSFTGGSDGEEPNGGLILDAAGNLYGVTGFGGTGGSGVVFMINSARQETVLYSFSGGADGKSPNCVIADAAGNFYGTTSEGGTTFEGYGLNGYLSTGVVYKLDTAGAETAVPFPLGPDGENPDYSLTNDAAGNLYGTTPAGGAFGEGTVFQVSPTGQETVLYAFQGGAGGQQPTGGLAIDGAGNLYGLASGGADGQGVLFKVDSAGHETPLYTFTGGLDGGGLPAFGSSLLVDSAGSVYGTTYHGGVGNYGVIFKVDASGRETVLHNFDGVAGSLPASGVIADAKGNLYGTTNGGATDGAGGTIYQLSATGQFTVLYVFTGTANGFLPSSALIRDAAGNLYGTTESGGAHNDGVIYRLSPAGKETVLYSFTGMADGSSPVSGVVGDPEGNLYGTTCSRSAAYELSTSGVLTVLHQFLGGPDGGTACGGLIRSKAGKLYGTAVYGGKHDAGIVYELTTP